VLKLLRQNIAENLDTVLSSPRQRKGKGKTSKSSNKKTNSTAASAKTTATTPDDKILIQALDWETDSVANLPPVDLVIACDCIYNEALIEPLNSTCAALCKLGDAQDKQTLCLVAQQLRSPHVFEAWLTSFHRKFWVWRVPDALLSEGLSEGSGFVVHVGVVR